jgi:hypothetical protein
MKPSLTHSRRISLALASFGFALAANASAAVLVAYNFNDTSNTAANSHRVASTVHDGFSATSVSAGTSTNSGNSNVNPSTNHESSGVLSTGTYQTAGLSTGSVFTFTLSLTDLLLMADLESFSIAHARAGTGDRSFQVHYSYDNFETSGVLVGTGLAKAALNAGNFVTHTYSLSNLISAGSNGNLTFRVTPGGGSTMRFDTIVVNGTVSEVIPEPSSAALLLGTLGGFALLRRRH